MRDKNASKLYCIEIPVQSSNQLHSIQFNACNFCLSVITTSRSRSIHWQYDCPLPSSVCLPPEFKHMKKLTEKSWLSVQSFANIWLQLRAPCPQGIQSPVCLSLERKALLFSNSFWWALTVKSVNSEQTMHWLIPSVRDRDRHFSVQPIISSER